MTPNFQNAQEWHLDQRQGWQNRAIPGNPKITAIVASYQRPRQLLSTVSALMAQTWRNYEIFIVHDGPEGAEPCKEVARILGDLDHNVHYYELERNYKDWGNTSKEWGSQWASGDYIMHSNDDNYYAPVYFEAMLHALTTTGAGIAYSNMVHSHHGYRPWETQPRPAYIDGGGWVARADLVKNTPWPADKANSEADGQFFMEMTKKTPQVKVPQVLFVHN